MLMRRLTAAETALLVDEHLSNRTWMQHIQRYQQFARDVFGSEAASISLGLGLIYNDEENVPGVATAAAYDAAGMPLEPITPLPQGWGVRRVRDNPRVRVAERPVPIVALHASKHHRPLPEPYGQLMNFHFSRPPHATFEAAFRQLGAGEPGNTEDIVEPTASNIRYRRLSPSDHDDLANEIDPGPSRQFVHYIFGRGASYVKCEWTSINCVDHGACFRRHLTVHNAEGDELQPNEGNVARGTWLEWVLPRSMNSVEFGITAALAINRAGFAFRGLEDGCWQVLESALIDGHWQIVGPSSTPPGLVDPIKLFHLNGVEREGLNAIYVEDLDRSEVRARVEEDWRFPAIPLALSTDMVYNGDPTDDFLPEDDDPPGNERADYEPSPDELYDIGDVDLDIPF